MTQHALIARLRRVEEALVLGVGALEVEASNYHEAMKGYRPERHAAMDREVEQANTALSDLRELIREAEESVPFGWYGDVHGFTDNQDDADAWIFREHEVHTLYTALGEKP